MNITLPTGLSKDKIITEIKKSIYAYGRRTCVMDVNRLRDASKDFTLEQEFIDYCEIRFRTLS